MPHKLVQGCVIREIVVNSRRILVFKIVQWTLRRVVTFSPPPFADQSNFVTQQH